MISIAIPKKHEARTGRASAVLALVPPNHTRWPLVLLGSGKHFIGTRSDCSVRVEAEGVQPRHAMILIGEHTILLKALDPKTWVNDSATTETKLRPGDRISIGPITYLARMATPAELNSYHTTTPDPSVSDEDESMSERSAEHQYRVDQTTTTESVVAPPAIPEVLAFADRAAIESVITSREVPQVVQSLDAATAAIEPLTMVTASSDSVDVYAVPRIEETKSEQADDLSISKSRLRDLHRQIAELDEETTSFDHIPAAPVVSDESQRLAARENELNQLALELSRQSQRLRERANRLAERESEVERKQANLAAENERLVATAQSTRRELADEHARQVALWQEWDAAYRRTSDELKTQLETVEQRRAAVQAEHERFAQDRAEIQKLQAEFESERRSVAADRVQATADLGELHAQRATFETERRQHFVDLQEREAQLASERRALAVAQDELLATQQQFQHDRTIFAAERSSESLRREEEMREHSRTRIRLNDEASDLQSTRRELESARRMIDDERAQLTSEKERLEAARSEVDGLRTRISQLESELEQSRHAQREFRSQSEAAQLEVDRQRSERQEWQKSVEQQQVQLDAIRTSLELERKAISTARTEMAATVANQVSARTEHPAYSVSDDLQQSPGAIGRLLGLSTNDLHRETFHGVSHEPVIGNSGFLADSEPQPNRSKDFPSMSLGDSHQSDGPIPAVYGGLDETGYVPRHPTSGFAGETSSELSPSLPSIHGESLADELVSVAVETEPALLEDNTAVANSAEIVPSEESKEVDQTLAEVNEQFGYVSRLLDQCLIQTPTDESSAKKSTRPPADSFLLPDVSVPSEEASEPSSHPGNAAEDASSLPSLRAQLAQMFDLSEVDLHNESATVASNVSDEASTEIEDVPLSDERDRLSASDQNDRYEMLTGKLEGTVESKNHPESVVKTDHDSEHVVSEEPEEEETSWTRRLRELSQMVDTHSAAAVPTQTPTPTPTASASSPDDKKEEPAEVSTNEDEGEYSVEAQLARLLGRPIQGAIHRIGEPESTNRSSSLPVTAGQLERLEPTHNPEPADRSHLTEEPKHKQNRSAVMEEVQSFRAVAQMSARTALAKHSWNALKNDFYLASGLTSVSTVATAWFIGTFLYGADTDPWKGVACAAATVFSSHRLLRTFAKLNQVRRVNTKRTDSDDNTESRLAALKGEAAE